MLFELTTGRRLFKAASEYETLKLICERDYPLPSQVRAGYPPALEAIVMRALAQGPRRSGGRAPREMQGALEEFVRRERIGASRVGLSHFMRALFAEKLASQRRRCSRTSSSPTGIARRETPRAGGRRGGMRERARPRASARRRRAP